MSDFRLLNSVAKTTLCVFVSLYALVAMQAYAKDYLVSNQNAYKEALKKLKPGDNLILANGNWSNFEILFEAHGQADKPITLKAQSPGKVIISGRSNLRIAGEQLVIRDLVFRDGYSPSSAVVSFRRNKVRLAKHSRFTNNVIENFSQLDRSNKDSWILLFGQHNRVDHNAIAGKTNRGPTLAVRLTSAESRQNYHSIDHNFFGHRPTLGGNGGETIRIGVSQHSRTASFTTVSQNYFERCDGEVEIISVKSERNFIKENVFYESRGAVVLRHGGHNVISRNVFFGNGVSDTGGIRIINDHQTVKENYFENLKGTKFLSALTVMNGVPNSPENRYHQVDRALIERNSFIDIRTLGFGVGSDQERSATPINSRFQYNLISTKYKNVISIFDDIKGISFRKNISTNPNLKSFVSEIKPVLELIRAQNGLLYPKTSQTSELAGAPRDLSPITRSKTGPTWYTKPAIKLQLLKPLKIKNAKDFEDAVNNSQPGTVLQLTKDHYLLSQPLVIKNNLTIRGAKGNKKMPTISAKGHTLLEIHANADLTLEQLKLKPTRRNTSIIDIQGSRYQGSYSLKLNNVSVLPSNKMQSIPFLRADMNTFATHIAFNSVSVKNWNGPLILLGGAGLKGWYLAEDVDINNSVFENIKGPLISYGREGRDESTFGPRFSLSNSQLHYIGQHGRSLNLDGIDGIDIHDSTISQSGNIHIKKRVLGLPFKFEKNYLDRTPILLEDSGEYQSLTISNEK